MAPSAPQAAERHLRARPAHAPPATTATPPPQPVARALAARARPASAVWVARVAPPRPWLAQLAASLPWARHLLLARLAWPVASVACALPVPTATLAPTTTSTTALYSPCHFNTSAAPAAALHATTILSLACIVLMYGTILPMVRRRMEPQLLEAAPREIQRCGRSHMLGLHLLARLCLGLQRPGGGGLHGQLGRLRALPCWLQLRERRQRASGALHLLCGLRLDGSGQHLLHWHLGDVRVLSID